jgi:hypothetical protein
MGPEPVLIEVKEAGERGSDLLNLRHALRDHVISAAHRRSVSASIREALLVLRTVHPLDRGGAGIWPPAIWVSLVVNAQLLNGLTTPLSPTYVLILANRKSVLGDPRLVAGSSQRPPPAS